MSDEVKCGETRPDWARKCEVCGQSPIVPVTEMCGPCTFGEAATMLGQWWDEEGHECDGSCGRSPVVTMDSRELAVETPLGEALDGGGEIDE